MGRDADIPHPFERYRTHKKALSDQLSAFSHQLNRLS
jgi:hypothetical protein